MNRVASIAIDSQNYYQNNKRRVWIVGIAFLLLLVVLSVFVISKTVSASREGKRIKLVTCIEVKPGDTLWDIASEYISDDYDDMNQYIEEIKSSNGMTSDEIHSGNYIIVPYYKDTI